MILPLARFTEKNTLESIKIKKETYIQWKDNMNYDFSYETYNELKRNNSLPTTPKTNK